jgi:hypothetical protein
LKSKTCTVDEELDDVKPDELVDEAELAGCHRIVIYRVGWYIPEVCLYFDVLTNIYINSKIKKRIQIKKWFLKLF